MKSQEKRVAKLCEGMPNTARIRAVLDAIRADDSGLRDRLLKTTPWLSYKAHDLRVIDSIEAAHILSLRFDRTFFHLLAVRFACQLPHILAEKPPKDILAGIENMDTELLALASGAKIFAERIGLDLNQALAFSTVLDMEEVFAEISQSRDTLSDDDLEKANEVADTFQKAWSMQGNAIDNFDEAA